MRRSVVAVVAVLQMTTRSSLADDTKPDPVTTGSSSAEAAREAFRVGGELYDDGDYFRAAEKFQRALELSPKPELLYNLAQAERLTGRCAEALEHYRQFEATFAGPLPAGTREIIVQMEACVAAETRVARPVASAAPTTDPLLATPRVRPSVERDEASVPRGRGAGPLRTLAFGCLGGALVSGAVAIVSGLEAHSARSDLSRLSHGGEWTEDHTRSEARYEGARDRAIGLSVVTGVLGIAGGALMFMSGSGSGTTRRPSGASVSLDALRGISVTARLSF